MLQYVLAVVLQHVLALILHEQPGALSVLYFAAAVICLELSDPSTLLVDKVMEETGGAGVDCILDNGGGWLCSC